MGVDVGLANMALQAAECDALRAQLAVTSQRMEEKAAAEGEIMVRNIPSPIGIQM